MDPLYGQRSTYPKKDDLNKSWIVINAEGKSMGRVASFAASRLMGKDKVNYQPGVQVGDSVIIINADKVKLTGNKLYQKIYYRHSGYMGGMKEIPMATLKENKPEEIILKAIKGMLPSSRYGRALMTRVRVFKGEEHNLAAQKPREVEITGIEP